MSREYFESIVQFLNFGEKPLFGNDRLSNLRMILDHLNEVITPELDNTWKKSFDWWVYDVMAWRLFIKNKHRKYGIKFYELCTHDGLVFTVEAYGGQGFNDEYNLAIVLKLMNPFLIKGIKCSLIITTFRLL